jgi:hypothetical protein
MKTVSNILALAFLSIGATAAPLHTVVYTPTDSLFVNPERGFYSHREVQAEGSALSVSGLLSIRNTKGQSLILRLYYLKKFRTGELSQAQLMLMEADFAAMRAAGVKCVLRFAYSQSESEADAPLSTVLSHLDQLKPLLEANRDVIAVVQAGFIGAWGEWYYSSNGLNNTSDRRTVLNKILEVLPVERMAQVRTPNYKQAIFSITQPLTALEAYTGIPVARTGHHNDCFLASEDDYGTYQDTSADKAYLSADTRFVPIGGETCAPSQFSGCANALRELARMRWTYLNSDYNSYVLAGWTSGGCMDEVKRRLGYRFELVEGQFADSVGPGTGLAVRIRITNRGWAAPFNRRPFHLILRKDGDTTTYYAPLPVDPRFWPAGDTTTVDVTVGVPASVEPARYELLLALPDPAENLQARPEYSIRFANVGVWEPGTGFNRLGHTVTVDPAASGGTYPDTLLFRPLNGTTGIRDIPELPGDHLRLLGSYPNPFNGEARILFTLARRSSVELSVYDMLGREVYSRAGEENSPGRHEILFDAGGLSSGSYIYRLRSLGAHASGRFLLLK